MYYRVNIDNKEIDEDEFIEISNNIFQKLSTDRKNKLLACSKSDAKSKSQSPQRLLFEVKDKEKQGVKMKTPKDSDLYAKYLQSKIIKERWIEEEQKRNKNKEIEECTFKPKTIPLNKSIFSHKDNIKGITDSISLKSLLPKKPFSISDCEKQGKNLYKV